MTKTIKYIIGIVSVTIILLLVIPFFISLDTYKEIIAVQVKTHTGRDLKIDGKITLDILPVPQIKLSKLKLSSLPQAKNVNFLESEIVSAKLALGPLLKGKIVITSLEMQKPVINLERLKNGNSTWEFQNSKVAETQVVSAESKDAIEDLPFIINDISIKQGRLKYIDKDKNVYIEDLDLDIAIADISTPINTHSNSSQASGGHWSNKTIDLSVLSSVNATMYLKAKKFTYGTLVFDNITMKSELDDGLLKIRSLTGGIYSGKIDVSGSISGKSNQPIALNLILKNAKIHNIIPEGRKIKVTDGIVDLVCDIQSYGASQFDYVKNMRGSFNLVGKDGKVSGMALNKLVHVLDKPRDINALVSGLDDAIGKGETAFQSLKTDFSIEKGIMNITKSELISNDTSAVFTGKINLPQFTLDISSTINSGVKNIPPITINFYGSIDNPQHKVDVKAIWKHLVKNTLTGVIDNLKQGKVKPQDLLKGVFNQDNKSSNTGDTSSSELENNDSSPQDAANKLLEKGIKGLFQ